MGNYWDVWVFGVVDVVSGIFVFMEVLCGLGELLKLGWWFCWIIMFCSWDVEEFFIVGFVEYVEENV